MDKIVIVMPSYNERTNIAEMIPTLFEKEFPKITNADMHLLIVDDHSPDGTGQLVKDAMKKYKNLHLLEGEKQGLGWAYIRGFKYAVQELGADAVMEMDADFQHPPRFVKPMVDAYTAGADYVIGSRYIPGGSVPKEWAFSRRFISWAGNLFIRLVLFKPSLHDLTTGFRLTRVKGVLDKIDLDHIRELKRFAYKVDLLYQSIKNSKKTVEVPLEFAPRTQEVSKFNPKEMIATFKLAILLGILDKQRFIKFAIVGFVGFIVNAIGIEFFRRTSLTINLANASSGLQNIWGLSIFAEPSSWAAALGAELAIISNFLFNNFWTFKEKRITNLMDGISKFLLFNFTSLGAIIIQFIVIGGAVSAFGDVALVRQIALIIAIGFLIIPYNYAMYNLFIWKTWRLGKK
jgi:dolichol-phosphate mannosyltransferase